MSRDLVREKAPLWRLNLQAPAALFETVEVQIEPADLTVLCGHCLEQPVAVGEPAVSGIDASSLSVHEPKGFHDDSIAAAGVQTGL